MMEKNMGTLDRTIRLMVGLLLIPTGLVLLEGWLGIVIAVVGLVPIATSVTGVCPGYWPLGISTRPKPPHGPAM